MESRQWGTSRRCHSSYIFCFYLNEVLTKLANLPLGCELICSRVNNFCYADKSALLAPTESALQFMHDILALKLEKLSLKINVEKSCNIVFKLKNISTSTSLTLEI